MSGSRIGVTCRQALPGDTPAVFKLTSTIWEGHDYVPSVWQDWLADPQGRLLVAEYEKKVVGISKLSRLSALDWWMEGLRVDPQYEGRGIASQLHDATLQVWQQIGCGTVRLGTASFRLPVHHLCTRTGFDKVAELAPFYASAIETIEPLPEFAPLTLPQVDEAVIFAQNPPSLELTAGLVDLGWHYAPPRLEFMSDAIGRGMAWWWRSRQGLLTVRIDEDDELGNAPFIEVLACSWEDFPRLLLDFRRLAASLGYLKAAWMAPLLPVIVSLLENEGYQRVWENSLFIYAQEHPLHLGCS